MTFRGNDFSGPRRPRGYVPATPRAAGGRDQWNGEWPSRGYRPDPASNYAREYRGGSRWAPRSGGYGRDFDRDRQPLSDSFDRVNRERQDPRWQGDSQRIRQEMGRFGDPARGFGQATAWNRYWNEGRGSGREVGRGRDDGFRPRSYF